MIARTTSKHLPFSAANMQKQQVTPASKKNCEKLEGLHKPFRHARIVGAYSDHGALQQGTMGPIASFGK
jgi:hypothetical protein